MSHSTTAYRPDIDGLRALAVGSVLLFHAFPAAVPGGFVGVDIFFVISGYLITSILVRESQENRFSILRFYVRRARRIFPALVLVLAVTLLVGWLILLPVEWRQLGKHVASGAVFVSNLTLWREAGYFDGSSELKPLLHLWSLAVEEQYYLFWPLVVHFASRRGPRALALSAVALGIASLVACVVLTPVRPTESFYLPVTRIWELLIGSGLAIAMASGTRPPTLALAGRVADICSLVGLAAMLAAVVAFDRGTPFPGIAAALPTLGAAMVIAAGPGATVNRWVFSHRAVVWVGLISYPLYLWHWPVLAFARIWTGATLPTALGAGLLLVAVALAWLTYRFAEGPIRDGGRNRKAAHDAAVLWGLILVLGAIGVLAWAKLVPPRSARSAVVQHVTEAQTDWEDVRDGDLPGGKEGVVLFVGDSHMQHYLPRVAKIMREQGAKAHSARIVTLSGCAPVPGLNRRALDCGAFVDRAYAAMQAPDVRTIVLAGSWVGFTERGDYYRRGDVQRTLVDPLDPAQAWLWSDWSRQLKALVDGGKRVVLVLSSPRGPLVQPVGLVERSLWSWQTSHTQPRPIAELRRLVDPVDDRVRAVAKASGAETLDPFSALCSSTACAVVGTDGVPLFSDDSHFRSGYVRDGLHLFDGLLLTP